MDFWRRPARASDGQPGLLHGVLLTFASHERLWLPVPWMVSASSSSSTTRSPFRVTTSPPTRTRATSRICSAMRGSRSMRTCRSWASSTSRLVRVSAVTVADLRVRRSAATSPKIMTGAEPDALVLELDLHFSSRDEVHGMSRLAALGDDVSGLDLLRAQEPHDVGDIRRLQFREQGHARDHAPSDNKVATVDLVGEGGSDDADRQ